MANKKATAYVLNCGPSMTTLLPKHDTDAFQASVSYVQSMLEDKALAGRKTDITTIIMAGTEESDNHLAAELVGQDQYQHITTLSELAPPTAEVIRKLVNWTPVKSKKNAADIFDALIVAIDIIVKKCRKLKYDKKIYVMTNVKEHVNWQDTEDVQRMLTENDIELNVVYACYLSMLMCRVSMFTRCVGADEFLNEDGEMSGASIESVNVQQWKSLAKNTPNGSVKSLLTAMDEVSIFRTKEVRPTPSFRGYLTLGDVQKDPETALSISITMFARTYQPKQETATKVSALALAGPSTGEEEVRNRGVTIDKKYLKRKTNNNNANAENSNNNNANNASDAMDTSGDQEEVEVPAETLEKAFWFGKSAVVIREDIEEYMRLKTTPGMAILGFLDESKVPRDYFMSQVYVVVPGSDKPNFSGTALSAFAQALEERKCYALVRYVSRIDSPPKMGVLIPYIERGDKNEVRLAVLHFVQLPFADDIHAFTFNPLDQVVTASGRVITDNHPLLPTQEQVEAIDKLLDLMDLQKLETSDDFDADKLYEPETIYNPRIWRQNKAIAARALNPAAPIPELHTKLQEQFKPVPQIVEKTKDHAASIKSLFNIKKVERRSKKRTFGVGQEGRTTRADGAAMPSIEQILEPQADQESHTKRIKIEDESAYDAALQSIINKDVREVSTKTPISDFKAMIDNRNEDLVSQAVEQMCGVIKQLVTESFGDQRYNLALECLQVLRATSAKENESEAFNNFMHQLKKECDPANPEARRRDFWQLLKDNRISLITKGEAEDSDITAEESDKFLSDTLEETLTAPAPPKENEDAMDTEDLLAMME